MKSEGCKDIENDVTMAIAYLHMFIAELKQLVKYNDYEHPVRGSVQWYYVAATGQRAG